jgi:protein O-GlcNAc transferase
LVTHSLADYESQAMQLATEPARIAGLKQRLASNRDTHSLFDTDRFTRNLEAAYLAMWERTQRGQAPEGFAVPAP